MFNNKNFFIALTYRCNAFCKKCMTRYHINKEHEMSKRIIDRICSMMLFNGYQSWVSVGTGEPLLYDNFQYFVESILRINSRIRLRLLTNGMLLSNSNSKAVFNNRIKWGITMDAFNQDSLEGLQKGVDIEKVKNNVRSISKKYGGSQLYLNFTVSNNNIDEILPFCMFAVENGIDEIYLTELKIFSGYEKDLADYRVIHNQHLSEKIEEVKNYLNKNGISSGGINIGRNTNRCKCYIKHVASPMIDVDGSVSFCSGREDIVIGNIMQQDIQKKWKDMADNLERKNICWCDKCYDKIGAEGLYNLPKTIRKEKQYD